MEPPQPTPAQTTTSQAARWLSLTAALIALAAALWVALGTCNACHRAAASLAGIPLAWFGAAFYALLALLVALRGLSPLTRAAFYAACGTHAVLVGMMAAEKNICPACLVAAAAALAGGIACIAPFAHALRVLLLPWLVVGLLSFGSFRAQQWLEPNRPNNPAPPSTLAGDDTIQPIPPGHVRLIVYEREGCKHCLQFEEDQLPLLQKALGDRLEVVRLPADIAMETPRIIVQGTGDDQTFDGLPDYGELERVTLNAATTQPGNP